MPRAAALMEKYLNLYIPLESLADDFYASQHEIGYLEGASLIEYMVRTFGWEAFSAFYRDIHINQGESQSKAIDSALQSHFSISFAQLEKDFQTALSHEPDTLAWVDDVRFSVVYYDTLRRYQQLLDPSAYFRTAWLMDNQAMRQRRIVADYLRHPHTPQNLALETLFITSSLQISKAQYSDASVTLDIINAVLDNIELGFPDPFSITKMSSDYFSISVLLQQQGYEVQSIDIDGNEAIALASNSKESALMELHLAFSGSEWILSPLK